MPAIAAGPRFGMAYDVTGEQRFVVRGGAGVYFDRARQAQQILAGNRAQFVTVRYAQLQNFGTGGLSTQGVPTIGGFEYDAPLPGAVAWNAGMQTMLPWATSLDVAYTGHHNYNAQLGGQTLPFNLNTIDLGTGFNPALQDRSIAPTGVPGATSLAAQNPGLVRGYSRLRHHRLAAVPVRAGGRSTPWSSRSTAGSGTACSSGSATPGSCRTSPASTRGTTTGPMARWCSGPIRPRRRSSSETSRPRRTTSRRPSSGNCPGSLRPTTRRSRRSAWSSTTGSSPASGSAPRAAPIPSCQSYQTGNANVNLTGSPDFAPRIRIVGDPGKGCSSDPYRQFNTAAFQGPLVGSVGLESGNGYLFGCFSSVLDLSIARNIRLGGSRTLQLRVDMFNAPNAAGVTGRNTNASAEQHGRSGHAAESAVRRRTATSCPTACSRIRRASARSTSYQNAANDSGVHPVRILIGSCSRPSRRSGDEEIRRLYPGLLFSCSVLF